MRTWFIRSTRGKKGQKDKSVNQGDTALGRDMERKREDMKQ